MFTHTHTHRGKQVKWRTYKLNGRNNYGTAVDVRVCSAQLFGRGRHRLIRKRKHIFPALRQLIMLSRVWLFVTLWTVACQAPLPWHSPGKNTGVGCHFLLLGSSQTRDQTQVSRIGGRHFNLWATRGYATLIDLCRLNYPLILVLYHTWSWHNPFNVLLNSICWDFVYNFCMYINQRYWPAAFFSCSVIRLW